MKKQTTQLDPTTFEGSNEDMIWDLCRIQQWGVGYFGADKDGDAYVCPCLLYTSPSPRDATLSRMPSSA